MSKNRWITKTFIAVVAFALISASFLGLWAFDSATANAETNNKVYFAASSFQAQGSGLVYAELVVEGAAGQTVRVTYRTQSGTAIPGVDYTEITNTVSITIGADGKGSYTIAIMTTADSASRQKLRAYSGETIYGRYFSIVIDDADNAVITQGHCDCYLSYESEVAATVGLRQDNYEVAYLDDYVLMQSIYNKGKSNLDGRKTWKSWNSGVSFVNETTARWLNAFVNAGFASAYGSYLLRYIDNSSFHSSTDNYLLAGNYEFISKYKSVNKDVPGMYLYVGHEPKRSGAGLFDGNADKLNGRAMYLISIGKDPYDDNGDYIQVNSSVVSPNHKRVYWVQNGDAWYAKNNTFTDSVFYKIDPYAGVLDNGLIVWNKNKEVDITFKDIWFFMTLIDDTCPTLVAQYLDDSRVESHGKLRMYLRFSEPVYASAKKSLSLKINSSVTPYYADYVEGNYTDTLVYEMDVPATDVKTVTFQLPSNDIGDMSYYLDSYRNVQNNMVQNTDQNRYFTMLNGNINYVKPRLAIDKSSNVSPKNSYNLLVSINDNGNVDLNEGTIYYEWSKDENKAQKEDVSVYPNSRRLVAEDMGSINVSLAKNEEEGVDSGVYYLHALAVGRYGLKATATYGPYVLDGDPPVLTQQPLPANELKYKNYVFVNGKEGGAGIVNVSLVAKWKDGETWNTDALPLMTNGECVNGFGATDETHYRYVSNIDPLDEDGDAAPDTPLDQFVLGLMGEKPRIELTVHFEAEDAAGNRAVSNAVTVVYDKRDTFKVTSTFPQEQGYLPVTDIAISYPVYDIATVVRTDGNGIVVSVAQDDRSQVEEGTVFQVFVGDKAYTEGPDQYTVVLGDLTPGYYQLVPNIKGTVAETEIDLVANPICFYLTDGKHDDTVNRARSCEDMVFVGKVFLIEDARYYYLDREDKVANHAYGATYNPQQSRYEGGSSRPAFSSVTEAKKYVRYMEYQDMHLVALSANMASMLNNSAGTTTYVKASGETRTAQAGQLWVRYKKSGWTTSSNAYGWAYYFYSDSGSVDAGLDLNRLSPNLSEAVAAVVNRIVSAGETVYLVTDDYLDVRSGAPYLALAQIHVEQETASTTKTGVSFINGPVYEGDGAIYLNTVRIEDHDYPVATNMALSVDDGTILYYRYYESDVWYPLEAADGQLLSAVLRDNASGIYTIREYGASGVGEFDIYYDRTTPTLRMTINGQPYELDGTVVSYSGSTASLDALTGEIDDYGYVAIYAYPSRALRTVLYRDDVAGYDLGSDNYYIQVGDRSGNIISYTILLSNTKLDVTIDKSEAQSGIVIRVSNRNDSEIYSYEVYLNEELLSSEYTPTKVCKDPGVYRVVVVDIYGNVVTKTFEYEFPSPRITWYYLNSMGGYSKYDPANVVSMLVKADPTSSRLSNVYTSTRVRLAFDTTYGDSAIRFEMLDIQEGEYSYIESTGVININTDASWRLRVWFEDYPQNDHIYVCHMDVEAPQFDASFVGVSYVFNASLDNADFVAQYEEGDVISLDVLSFDENAVTENSFATGSIISGSHITVGLFDPSGIRSYSVTRNGQSVALSLNEEGQLLINNYGTYVITAIDSLGNKSTFGFSNIKEPVATATIDGEPLDEDLAYGSDAIEVVTAYASTTTILVKTGTGNFTYVFDYQDASLTYGQYVCVIDAEESGKKYAESVNTNGFAMRFNDDSVRRNRWFEVIVDFDYTVAVQMDDKNVLHYKVTSVQERIDVEIMVGVGTNKRPSRFAVALSQVAPTLTVLTNGEPAEIIEKLNYIFVAGTLTIGDIDPDITDIQVGYSETEDVRDFAPIYQNGAFLTDFAGQEDGYYTLVATNLFHNQTVYRVCKIKAFGSLVTVTYMDGMTREYMGNPPLITSNYTIEVTVFSNNVRFEVNDNTYDGMVQGGISTLTLTRQGQYDVKVIASNGVYENFHFEIASDNGFVFHEEWLVGYNEQALLRDQGYTNQILTAVLAQGVEYIDMVYQDTVTVLYDNVSETSIVDVQALQSAVGKLGNGVYQVNFRNVYGDVVSKTIHFNMVPTLSLTRKTLARPSEWEDYPVSAASEGFYSNYVLRFATDSVSYVFRLNGNAVSLADPKTIELDQTSGNGTFEYDVYYMDEYGNGIQFKAVLMRADVQIETSEMQEIDVEGKKYTKDNVVITFPASCRATVAIDGDAAVPYVSGTKFYRDGTYAFGIEDIAGNRLEYTIIHKSVNHYTLTEAQTGVPVIMGGVVNNSAVIFEASDDSVVKTMVKDGVAQDTANNKSFKTTGHWELLIVDSIGNTSYAEFYVINNSLGSFEYTAPYNYTVDDLWKTDDRGNNTPIAVEGNTLHLTENGDYVVGVMGVGILSSYRFTVTIDNTPPSVTLTGVEDGGITARNVTIKGLSNGDVVKIFKNGELLATVEVSTSNKVPEITTGGDYRIVVTNVQGVSSEYTFTRKKIANTATSIFLIILLAMAVVGVSIGLLYHTRQKTDS